MKNIRNELESGMYQKFKVIMELELQPNIHLMKVADKVLGAKSDRLIHVNFDSHISMKVRSCFKSPRWI